MSYTILAIIIVITIVVGLVVIVIFISNFCQIKISVYCQISSGYMERMNVYLRNNKNKK